MVHTRTNTYSLLVALVVLTLSLFVYPMYTGGDQIHYRHFYDSVGYLPIDDVLGYQKRALSSAEPVYAYVVYVASKFWDKDVFFSTINALLAFFASRLLIKWGAHFSVVFFLVAVNFYSLVLYFAAERLKLAVLLLILAISAQGTLRLVCAALCPMAHSQLLALYASIGASRVVSILREKRTIGYGHKKIRIYTGLGVGLGLIVLVLAQGEHILAKWDSYAEADAFGIAKTLVFLVAAILIAPRRSNAIAAMLPIVALAFYLGGDRLNMFAFYIYAYSSLGVNSGRHMLNFLLLGYYSLTGFAFVGEIVRYGTGFS